MEIDSRLGLLAESSLLAKPVEHGRIGHVGPFLRAPFPDRPADIQPGKVGDLERPHGEAEFLQRLVDFKRQRPLRSEEHTSELQSLMRISYAVFCLKKKKQQ